MRPFGQMAAAAVRRGRAWWVAAWSLAGMWLVAMRTSRIRLAAYLLRDESKLTAAGAGVALGGKDHSSILYAQKKFEEEHAASAELRELTAMVRAALR